MKTVVSVLGRFHAFDLARELHAQEALEHLFTSYPGSHAARFGVPADRVTAMPWNEALNRGSQRLERRTGGRLDLRAWPCAAHDRSVARLLRPGADVFVGWSGSTLASLARARELGMLACVERGSTHILHQRDLLAAEYERWGLAGRLPDARVVERELAEYELADRIVVPTEHVASTFVRRGVPRERLLQVPYGVSLDAFRAPATPREANSPFVLMHCGNVSLRKGCHYLVDAFLRLRLPGARLVFVGPVSEELQAFLADRLPHAGGSIELVGRVPQAELVQHYERASAFALASLEEGLAMVLPQAMATGLPVLATRESGAAELIRPGEEGLLVPARDVDALADGIERLYRDRDASLAMGARAAARVATGFSWKDYGRRVAEAYAGALDPLSPVRKCA